MKERSDDKFSREETERRRDEVVRRMANTPPQPKSKTPARHQKKEKKAGAGRAARKDRVRREA